MIIETINHCPIMYNKISPKFQRKFSKKKKKTIQKLFKEIRNFIEINYLAFITKQKLNIIIINCYLQEFAWKEPF